MLSRAGRDARQPPQSGAPHQVQQHCFGVVVGVVGGGDHGAVQLTGRLLKEIVPHLPGGLLDALAGPGSLSGHVPPAHGQLRSRQGLGHAQGAGVPVGAAALGHELPDELFVPVGFRPPQAVVVVGGGHLDVQPAPQPVQKVHQAYGVRPPGQGAQHTGPRGQHPVFCDQLLCRLQHNTPPFIAAKPAVLGFAGACQFVYVCGIA